MVGSDRDRDHAIGIVGGSHPRHGMSDPGEPQPARSHDRLLARKDSDIHTVLTAQDLEFGPQVGAGRALRRSRHFHDKSRGISFQRRTKLRWEIAGAGDARQPALPRRGTGHRRDRSTHRSFLRHLLVAGGLASLPPTPDTPYSTKNIKRS